MSNFPVSLPVSPTLEEPVMIPIFPVIRLDIEDNRPLWYSNNASWAEKENWGNLPPIVTSDTITLRFDIIIRDFRVLMV